MKKAGDYPAPEHRSFVLLVCTRRLVACRRRFPLHTGWFLRTCPPLEAQRSAPRWRLCAEIARLHAEATSVLLAAFGAAVLAGGLRPAHAQHEVTTDRWHSVRDACPGGGTVQMRPVAVLGARSRVESWRVDLRVPVNSTCSFPGPERLYLTVGGERIAGPFEKVEAAFEEGGEAGAQLSISESTAQRLIEADEVRIVERAIEGQTPEVFQNDLRRLMQKAPTLSRQKEGEETEDLSGEDERGSSPDDSQSGQAGEETSEEGEKVHMIVDEQPRLIGGMGRVQEMLQYPEAAKRKGLEGRVLLKLVVTENGNVRRPEVTRGVHELLNKEALRVARELKFEPGKLQGEAVKTQVTLPVPFRLPQDEK